MIECLICSDYEQSIKDKSSLTLYIFLLSMVDKQNVNNMTNQKPEGIRRQ